MNRFRRLSAVGVAIVLGLVVGGCGTAKAAPDPGFAGHWTSSQWGEHYILVDGATTKIIYEHDDGRILGVLDGSKVTGWWTESPSRQPTRDAGTVTFTLTVSGDTRTTPELGPDVGRRRHPRGHRGQVLRRDRFRPAPLTLRRPPAGRRTCRR
jgi:hypothetical protein